MNKRLTLKSLEKDLEALKVKSIKTNKSNTKSGLVGHDINNYILIDCILRVEQCGYL